MSIELPDFKDTQCVWVRACGQVESEGPSLVEILKKENTFIASYEAHGKKAFLRVCTGGPTKQHLHVDCTLSSCFQEGSLPKENKELSEVIAFISSFLGISASIGVTGVFDVPLEDLPEQGLIRSLSMEKRTGDISIKLTGAQFTIKGAPIENVEWEIPNDKDQVRIAIYGHRSDTIDEEYLMRVFNWIESQYQLFIKGKTEHANT